VNGPFDVARQHPYERLAAHFRAHVDVDRLVADCGLRG